MAVPDKYPIKDVEGLPEGVWLSFERRLRPELICCTCDAVTPKGLKDGKGHVFCQECVGVQTDCSNMFTCSLCGHQANSNDMLSNEKEWSVLQKMAVACPNEDKSCRFNGTLEDVLTHYKTCGQEGKVMCALCHSLQDRKTLAAHMKEECPRRVLECFFCQADIEACNKIKHESGCRKRPATCQHCGSDFQTIAELEDDHYEVCPLVLTHCSFEALGCEFYATRQDVTVHETKVKHTELLVHEVCRLKEENRCLIEDKKTLEERLQCLEKKVANGLTEDTRLQKRLRNIEDKQKEQDFQLDNLIATSKDLEEELKVLSEKAASPREDPELERRLTKLEKTNAVVQEPIEKLIQSIAGLK